MPYRILQIGPYPPPGTGWSVRIKMLKRYIEAAGHICAVMNTNKNRKVTSGEFVPVLSGWDYFVKVLRYCAGGYLVHMHINGKSTKSPLLALVAESLSLLFGRPAVLTFHAGVVQDYFPRQNKFWLDNVFRLIFLLAGRIICNNEEVKARIVEYGIRPEKITPIPAFCLEYLEDKTALPERLTAFAQKHEPLVCSYIYLRPDFNIDFFLQAMAQVVAAMPRLGLILMGADREQNMLQEKLQRYQLSSHTCIAGDLDHGDFLAVLEACRVYIRTPVADGVSSSVLEALMLGTTVVASENGARPPGVLTYRDGEVASFVQTLRAALAQPAQRAMDAEARRQRAQQLGVRDTLREELTLLLAAAAS
ncbi:MAG: glycosyltransferase family 4 protein [candidate division KSB1 bacterium]|nr:glycosyltransferase family 4 protein [candidate division KSB1 bacterium]MDZ7272776.1 glycosyltransferase family 4 protein [candidate division KSB1 bacterium]MDZ7284200.1 glycosyltransferase family 4 protein [candidate division KSB1 bacterium]MDZ7297402.1 glycosyltransferase family 4 protein [candidate division KSB1 bacterium]MDZ7306538.1 glycosyltransferase family 4 protein [candidate division KSB1 bacterium]